MKKVEKIVVAVSEISVRDTLLAEKCADAVWKDWDFWSFVHSLLWVATNANDLGRYNFIKKWLRQILLEKYI
jgi:hypothetical protein